MGSDDCPATTQNQRVSVHGIAAGPVDSTDVYLKRGILISAEYQFVIHFCVYGSQVLSHTGQSIFVASPIEKLVVVIDEVEVPSGTVRPLIHDQWHSWILHAAIELRKE
jgi:hypothetical protein